jgi:hypothetical protein
MISIDGRSMGCACIHAHGRVPRACSRLRLGADVMQRREQRRTAERSCRCGGNVIPAACVLADALPDPVGSLLCFPPCRCRRARQKRQDRDSVGRRVGDDPSVSRRTTGASCYLLAFSPPDPKPKATVLLCFFSSDDTVNQRTLRPKARH